MIALTDEKWQEINELIKKIYTVDMDSLLPWITDAAMELIPSANSMYHYYKKKGNKFAFYGYGSSNISTSVLEVYKKYEDVDYICWYTDTPQPRAYRDTDLISEELRLSTEIMQEWMIPNDLYYSLGSTIAADQHVYASISFFKGQSDEDFLDTDVRILEIINEHLSIRFQRDFDYVDADSPNTDLGILVKKFKLTDKEIDIISLVESGYLRDSLPEKLFISENTLKKHLYNIYRKLKINKFEELIQFTKDHLED